MNVGLLSYTENPDTVCNCAAETCVSENIPECAYSLHPLKVALKSGHESVAEHASFTFAIEGISRACSHQLVRHRMASYSQQSQRYVKMDRFDYVVPESIKNSDERIWCPMETDWVDVHSAYLTVMEHIAEIYEFTVKAGIPEEDARYILPNACTTNLVMTMNARELRHFFNLRLCTRAQWEIRELAEKMLELVKDVAPALFDDAGPSCVKLGYCPEKRGCGKVAKK